MLGLHQRVDDLRVEHGPAVAHLGDRAQQPVGVAESLLEQVRQALRALGQQLQRILGVVMLREHHDAEVGVLGPQLEGQVDPLGGVGRGHPDVEQHDVGAVHLPQLTQGRRVTGGAQDLQAADLLQDRPRALANEVVVVADEDARRGGGGTITHARRP